MLTKASSLHASLAVLSGSFLVWGILRSLDDILVALFNASSALPYAIATLVHLSFFSAYLLFSIPAGIYVHRHGYRKAILMALLSMAAGSAVCVAGVTVPSFPLCLIGIFTLATGVAALQTAGNPCIGLLGPERAATARLLVVQGFSSFGSILGPLAGSLLFGTWSRRDPAAALIFPSRRLAAIYLFLTGSLLFLVFLLRHLFADGLVPVRRSKEGMGWDLLRNSQLRFGVTAGFLYVGSEATLLSNAIPYLSRHYREGFLPATAATMLSLYWASVLVGRLCAVGFLKGIDTRTLLQGACGLAFLLLLLCMDRQDSLGGIGMLSVGLCNAIMFPSIFTLSVSGLREDQLPHASALLSTAICGGAVMPVLGGLLMDRFGVVWAFAPPCIAYAFIGVASSFFFPRDFHVRSNSHPQFAP